LRFEFEIDTLLPLLVAMTKRSAELVSTLLQLLNNLTTLILLFLTKTMHRVLSLFNHIVYSNLTLYRRLLALLIELMSFSENLRNVLLNLFFEQCLKFRVEAVLLTEINRQITSIVAFSN
jgi:hypothetical protein